MRCDLFAQTVTLYRLEGDTVRRTVLRGVHWQRGRRALPENAGTRTGTMMLLVSPAAAGEDGQSIPLSVYNSFASRLHRGFLPLIPGRGINGLMLTGGLELFFLRWRMPYSIHWGARSGSLFENIELMLMRDIPVILAVGPNFPLFWQKNTLSFYCREPDGTLVKSCAARAHYVVVTGMDEDWLRISSWGREYYINRGEYTAYGKKHSIPILNSIAVIKPKAR